jgi:7-carboxy-7-deazaguanine synthase
LRIAEVYKSVQGEGSLTGTESVFVRASGCNLRCWFCDTPYASWQPEGADVAVQDIVRRVLEFDAPHVVITGGEPMLFAELIPLCQQLHERNCHITIETAGTLHLPVVCDLMSISPKLGNSAPDASVHPRWHVRHEQSREVPEVIRRLVEEYDYQMKFVIDRAADVDDVEQYLGRFPEVSQQCVYLMPQGTDVEQLSRIADWLQPLCADRGWHFCPRKQIEWFGATRMT